MARKKLNRKCKSQLEQYYGEPRCIIDGATHFEYHHLDDRIGGSDTAVQI